MMLDEHRNQAVCFGPAGSHVLKRVVAAAGATQVGFLVGVLRRIGGESVLEIVYTDVDRFLVGYRAQMAGDFQSPPMRLLARVVGEGAVMAIVGVVAGATGGYCLARFAGKYFLDMPMPGALPVVGSALLLLTAAVIASALPAARAARVDVMQALRSD